MSKTWRGGSDFISHILPCIILCSDIYSETQLKAGTLYFWPICQQIFMTRLNSINFKTSITTDTFLISIFFEMESQLSISTYIKERSWEPWPHLFTGNPYPWFCLHYERAPPRFGHMSSKTSGCFWSDLFKQIPGDRCNRRSDRWQEFHH